MEAEEEEEEEEEVTGTAASSFFAVLTPAAVAAAELGRLKGMANGLFEVSATPPMTPRWSVRVVLVKWEV